VNADQLVKEMEKTANAIFWAVSFIKEMSPQSAEDHSYLFEREWRLVSALGFTGQPLPFRCLTPDEKESLCARRPIWRASRQSQDINITARYAATPVIDSFRYFNGLPGKETVAQLIDTILVPDEAEACWVRNFVAQRADQFGGKDPNLIIFPSD
jgi:hypothetical protein